MNTQTSAITAIVLSYNEESSIARCLESLKWVDEVILVDNSTDRTVEKAREIITAEKLQIITLPQTDDFAYLRNEAMKRAKNDWVLFIDADEVVPEELHKEIVANVGNTDVVGFYFKRQDFIWGRRLKHGETAQVQLLKLGKKDAGHFRRRVHEVWDISGKTITLKNPLHHYPHPTVAEFLAHINRWSTLDAQVFYESGIRSNYFKIIAYPTGKFIKNYFWHLGFLDGMPGLIVALMMSFHSFLTRGKLYMLQQKV